MLCIFRYRYYGLLQGTVAIIELLQYNQNSTPLLYVLKLVVHILNLM